MKTKFVDIRVALIHCSLVLLCLGTGSSASTRVQSASNLPTPGDCVCVTRSPNSRVWQRSVLKANVSGEVRTNLESYTEIQTGLAYLKNGQYDDSVAQIDAVRSVAEMLAMGHYTRVTQAVSRMNRKPGKTLEQLKKRLLQATRNA